SGITAAFRFSRNLERGEDDDVLFRNRRCRRLRERRYGEQRRRKWGEGSRYPSSRDGVHVVWWGIRGVSGAPVDRAGRPNERGIGLPAVPQSIIPRRGLPSAFCDIQIRKCGSASPKLLLSI